MEALLMLALVNLKAMLVVMIQAAVLCVLTEEW